MKTIRGIALFLLIFSCYGNVFGLGEDFVHKLNYLKWIAFAPTNFNPLNGTYPSAASIEKDLNILRDAGFTGIITYGSDNTLAVIPEIAKNMGFQGVIMGIWDIRDPREKDNALAMAGYVDGYCMGNEGLSIRYEVDELKKAIDELRDKSRLPVTTSEEINDYAKQYVVELGDWVFPNVHPYFSNVTQPAKAASWIRKYYKILKRAAGADKPILFKEVSLPTKGDDRCNERNQRDFFILMEFSEVKFAYFEAFDQPWKAHSPVEPHWGLFDKKRRPKKFIAEMLTRQTAVKVKTKTL